MAKDITQDETFKNNLRLLGEFKKDNIKISLTNQKYLNTTLTDIEDGNFILENEEITKNDFKDVEIRNTDIKYNNTSLDTNNNIVSNEITEFPTDEKEINIGNNKVNYQEPIIGNGIRKQEFEFPRNTRRNLNVEEDSNNKEINSNLLNNKILELEIVTNQENPNYVFQEQYTNDFIRSNRAKNKYENKELVEYSLEEVEKRVRNRESELELFLYNLIPYEIQNNINDINNIVNTENTGEGIIKGIILAANSIMKTSHLNFIEIITNYAYNFYFLQIRRGILVKGKIKKLGIGFAAEEWTGQPDIFFGSDVINTSSLLVDIENSFNQLFYSYKNFDTDVSNDNDNLVQAKKDFNTKLEIDTGAFTFNGVSNPFNINNPASLLRYLIEKNFPKIIPNLGRSIDFETTTNNKGNTVLSKFNTIDSYNSYDVMLNKRSLGIDKLDINEYPNKKETIDLRTLSFESDKEGKIIIDSEVNINNKLKNKYESKIGFIKAIPVIPEKYKDKFESYEIPFEFNPQIDEGGIQVQYQANQIVSRIGSLQSYINTGSITLSLTTEYYAVAGANELGQESQNWMQNYTLQQIQKIEMAYRSLAYPHFPDDDDPNAGYRYIKPPLIKIIMGDPEKPRESSPYSNLLTYQHKDFINNRLQASGSKFGNPVYRTFIATDVQIKKNIKEDPLVLDENLNIIDTFGFEVTVNMVEVTPSYADAPPDSLNYYKMAFGV